MQESVLSHITASLPAPGHPDRIALGHERWRDRAKLSADAGLADFANGLADDPVGHSLLDAIFGNSPFLSHCLLKEMAVVRAFMAGGGEAVLVDLLQSLRRDGDSETDTGRLGQILRIARRRVALVVALADLTGLWPLESVTAALSDFADAAIETIAGHLLRRGEANGEIVLPDPEMATRGSGLVILGMGKLGARELNYSSDIDLIVLYERERVAYNGRRSVQDFFVRLARDLVRLLQDRTDEGYVFRTDLRLRPDPASTPLAMSVQAAETYYEGMGQNWERAAMIKARPVAGDLEAGKRFLKHLRPFIWRKHLDFAAIQDIHSIKRQIHAVKGHRNIAVGGHDLKLGRGGIREIEFFAQTQQLIWGGRDPSLRVAGTCTAVQALVESGHVQAKVAEEMVAAYRYLRLVEHRLQMVDDRQTQTLPHPGAELDAIARFVGHGSTSEFTRVLLDHLGQVEDHYAELFEEAPHLGGPGSLVFTGTENDPDTVRTLTGMGFSDGASICGVIRGWHFGRYRATRSTRARELLTELMPTLLQCLARTANPDVAFAKFDEFLAGLPAGVQLFSLLHANPSLLDLIAEIMGEAPRLAEHLSRNPILLDAVLSRDFFEPPPARDVLAKQIDDQLRQATDFQDILDLSRRWAKDRQFQVGVRILRNIANADTSGAPLSDIAETVIAGLVPHVEAEFVRRHGRLPGDGLAIVALGKLGGREMTVSSDLDLICIYDAPQDEERAVAWDHLVSDGAKGLGPIHYYARLAQRIINALTALTNEGRLFDVDMRLRPSGTSGPIASSLDGFRRYQVTDAWTWEHMALTRGRVIASSPALAPRIAGVVRDILQRRRDSDRLVLDIADMRRRVAQQYPMDRMWDMKYSRGGLVDIEFVAQFLQLRHAAEHPQILHTNTSDALAALAAAGLIPPDEASALIGATRLWRRLLGLLRLTVGSRPDEAAMPEALRRALAKAGGADNFASLKEHMVAAAASVRTAYDRLIAEPAAAIKHEPKP